MNHNPEQLARDIINADLIRCGWGIQSKTKINLNTGLWVGVAVREFYPENNTSDFTCFVNKKPVCIIDGNPAMAGVNQYTTKAQRRGYTKIQGIFYRVIKKNLGAHVEQQIMAGDACSKNQKFVNLYPVPYQTLNHSK